MSRGGRSGFAGRGGRKGPDMSWDDEESTEVTPNARKPGPLFPDRYFPAPKPLSTKEKAGVASLVALRDRVRRGPLYAVLDPTIAQSTDVIIQRSSKDRTIPKINSRAGFDPFNDQEKYTMKYHRQRRTFPDLSERSGYTLKFFPLELWNVLDPKRRMKEWESLTEEQKARLSTGITRGRKRKREQALKFDDDEDALKKHESDSENSDEEDVVSPTRRRKGNHDRGKSGNEGRLSKQKKGLDAEDDYPDIDQQDDDAEEAGAGEDEPRDSEFETDEDDEDGADDYNAEQYFDDGEDDADGGGDGDEDGGRDYI